MYTLNQYLSVIKTLAEKNKFDTQNKTGREYVNNVKRHVRN